MYKFVKGIIKSLFSEKLIHQTEPVLRKVWSILYHGNTVSCPLCLRTYSRFVTYDNHELLCPGCGSIRRKRLLWLYIEDLTKRIDTNKKVLHFTPSRQLEQNMRHVFGKGYTTTDYCQSKADKQYDITAISCDDNTFDLIICYHVLEHVENDKSAMKELYRILRPKGIALLQVPFKEGETYEDFSIKTPKERLKAFGQEDHVRVYGLADFKTRLEAVGFTVSLINYAATLGHDLCQKYGLNNEETIVVCKKY